MSKFLEAYYKRGNKAISVQDYKEEIHYQKLFCPECQLAPIHIVKKQKTTYFASNRKSEHSENCQHFREIIDDKQIKFLTNSTNPKDEKRLNFLIQSNLNSAKRLLLKDVEIVSFPNTIVNKKSKNKLSDEKNKAVSEDKKESIKRVHIKNLIRKKDELVDKHLVIYGTANIKINYEKGNNKTTGEEYDLRIIYFENDGKSVFSILLTGRLLKYFNMEVKVKAEKSNFVVFGLFSIKEKYLNLKIARTKHIDFFRKEEN